MITSVHLLHSRDYLTSNIVLITSGHSYTVVITSGHSYTVVINSGHSYTVVITSGHPYTVVITSGPLSYNIDQLLSSSDRRDYLWSSLIQK